MTKPNTWSGWCTDAGQQGNAQSCHIIMKRKVCR